MRAVNLHLLTRIHDEETMSVLYQALSGRPAFKAISPHEAASLWKLADRIAAALRPFDKAGGENWLPLLDGFFVSYVIEHIGKEFDLLKISSDGNCALNIELKSEDIGEDRIRKQLEQNRYYLSHTAKSIFSFTYVMETDMLYCMNARGYLRPCGMDELIRVLQRPALSDCLGEDIDRFFRASDYLISPVAAPEKYLQGQYFLTNQQFDFRRKILAHLKEEARPVISVSGTAGTGKTLLLFDLAMILSKKSPVLVIHSGPLRKGHLQIDERLRNVSIRSGTGFLPMDILSGFSFLLIDEADHLEEKLLERLLLQARAGKIPVILTYDPHRLLSEKNNAANLIAASCSLSLSFTGNIRINRPVYSFLRTLLCLKDHSGTPDYSCIDVLYADTPGELRQIIDYCQSRGFEQIGAGGVNTSEENVIAQEYSKVLMVLDEHYQYDDSLHLRCSSEEEASLLLLYEGLSRTREHLCLLVAGNRLLFSQILDIRLHRLP